MVNETPFIARYITLKENLLRSGFSNKMSSSNFHPKKDPQTSLRTCPTPCHPPTKIWIVCSFAFRLATSRPLLASGASLFWPRSGRPRATKSREVDFSRLKGCHCILRQKWGVAWLAFGVSGFICESLTSMAECADSTPTKSIERVCVSPSSKEQICLLCAKVVSNNDFRRKLTSSGGRKKTKTCFNLESILGKEISIF